VKRKIPLYYLILLLLCFSATIGYFITRPPKVIERNASTVQLNVLRQSHYKYTHPLLLLDLFPEDPSFTDLKSNVQSFISNEKNSGKLKSASVYVRKLGGGKWFSINPEEEYSPGSVMKLVMLLTYLRDSESNPSILDKKIQFSNHFSETPVQTIVSNPLQPNHVYTVKELLNSMIIDSDNDATALLNQNANMDIYFSLLKNLNLSVPTVSQQDYPLNVTQCSFFFRMLYASTFLSPEKSEFALDLLTKSKFKGGLTKSLPGDVTVAHKFGERNENGNFQLHETGIVYFDDSPYLITVMTKGNDQAFLSEVIEGVSNIVYDYMKASRS
jgi:beta-lactamase class A